MYSAPWWLRCAMWPAIIRHYKRHYWIELSAVPEATWDSGYEAWSWTLVPPPYQTILGERKKSGRAKGACVYLPRQMADVTLKVPRTGLHRLLNHAASMKVCCTTMERNCIIERRKRKRALNWDAIKHVFRRWGLPSEVVHTQRLIRL